MGKKKDKVLAQQQGTAAAQIPWQQVDLDPVGFLVAPENGKEFLAGKWEQKPAIFKATPDRLALVHGLCTFPAVINWLKQREKKSGPLEFAVDVNAARYKDGIRETPNGDIADAATLQSLHNNDGCTLQLHQPQRFFDPCWRLLAALERQLGCLVGSNAYLTPASSQGLAPHYDDVELWVVQTAGTKKWRLYKNAGGYQLPNQPSGDLDQETLGAPVLEAELCVGDVLYMPRGTIHQAAADGASDSDHLTISTYQRSSYADLATHLLQVGLSSQNEPECLPLAARRSPAPGTLLQHSLHRVLAPANKGSTTPDAVAGLAGALRAIASKLEDCPDMFTSAVHSQAIDFLINRLPPHPKQLPARGPAPSMDDSVWCRVAGWCYLLPFEMTGMSCEDENEAGAEDGSVKLVSCLTNSREEHMMIQPDEDDSGSEDDTESENDDNEEHEQDSDSADPDTGAAADGDDAVDNAAKAAVAVPAAANGVDGATAHTEQQEGEAEGKRSSASRQKSRKAPARQHDGGADGCDATDLHHHHQQHDQCCSDDGCGAGVHEHSLTSGATERDDLVATLPGLVLAPALVKAVVAFMGAETRDKAVPIKDLPLPTDTQKLQLAFALWAEGFATTIPAQQQQQGKQLQQHQQAGAVKQHKQSSKQKKKRAAVAVVSSEGADDEHTATSSGKVHTSKKAKP